MTFKNSPTDLITLSIKKKMDTWAEAWEWTLDTSLFNSLPRLPRGLEPAQAPRERTRQSAVPLYATRGSAPNALRTLSERHCVIGLDSLCSHATVIQPKRRWGWKFTCMLFGERGRGRGGAGSKDERRAGSVV